MKCLIFILQLSINLLLIRNTMKKISISLLFIFAIFACQQNSDDNLDQNSRKASTSYLDIEADLDHTEISNLSIEEEKIYYEARERFGTLVEYKNEQFYLKEYNCEAINISPSLFEHFKTIMDHSNSYYNNLSNDQKEMLDSYSIINNISRTRTTTETVIGGIDGFARTWSGFDVYLSNNILLAMAFGADITGTIAALIPDPTLATKVIAGGCGLLVAVAGYTASTCPNGIIISYTYPAPVVGCIPFRIQKQ